MTKSDVKKRIAKAIQELNAMDNNVCFGFEETEYSVELSCQSRVRKLIVALFAAIFDLIVG